MNLTAWESVTDEVLAGVPYRVVVDCEFVDEWACYPAVVLRDDGDGFAVVHDFDGAADPETALAAALAWAAEDRQRLP